MVLEAATLQVRPGQKAAFGTAFRRASGIIASMAGYRSHERQRCLEGDGKHPLLVRRERLGDHTVGFRHSPEDQEWSRLLHHVDDPFPTVEHFVGIVGMVRVIDPEPSTATDTPDGQP